GAIAGAETLSVTVGSSSKARSPAVKLFGYRSTATAAPSCSGPAPPSPADNNIPSIVGTAEPSASVTFYTDAACSTQIAAWTANGAGAFSVPVLVADGTRNSFWGRAAFGSNVSPCVTAPSYVESSTGYLTILVARTSWVETNDACTPLSNTVDLGQVAGLLQKRGLAAVGSVIMDWTLASTRSCRTTQLTPGDPPGMVTYADWVDLANLRDQYGWSFVSHSKDYT